MHDNSETPAPKKPFDPSQYPEDTLFYERRTGTERRGPGSGESTGETRDCRRKQERRRRVDPTTFEKQYSPDEMEFMNAMQRFKVHSGKVFPSHGDVLRIARELGYRKAGEPF